MEVEKKNCTILDYLEVDTFIDAKDSLHEWRTAIVS